MTPRSRRISPLPRSLACLHCEKPVVSLFPHPSPFPPNRISIWGECNRWNSRVPESHRCKFHATLLLLLLRWHRSIQGENKSSSRFMNRFNQILINAAPPSDDHGSKYIYIYILLSVDRYIVWQFYHGMYIYIYIYLLHPIFPVFIEFRSRFRIEFTEPPYRATLFFLPLFILSESLNPSSSLAFEVSSEKNRSLFPRSSESKGTRIYPITFQIRYNFEEGGRGAQRVEWKSEGILLPSVFTANTY